MQAPILKIKKGYMNYMLNQGKKFGNQISREYKNTVLWTVFLPACPIKRCANT